MKPNDRSRIVCPGCGKPKMQFETERKAKDFIKWNAAEFKDGGKNLRTYYCKACCCWHITHAQYKEGYDSQLNNKIEAFKQQQDKRGRRLDVLIRSSDIETIMRQANEIYPRLNLSSQPKGSVKDAISKFLRKHESYQDSPILRAEIQHLYDINSRKKKKK